MSEVGMEAHSYWIALTTTCRYDWTTGNSRSRNPFDVTRFALYSELAFRTGTNEMERLIITLGAFG
jgi:hypothetical protein